VPRAVAIVSLYPLTDLGGGEQYTFGVAKAIRSAGDTCQLFARSRFGADTLPIAQRLDVSFTEYDACERPTRTLCCRELLTNLADFDLVWVHQFLSSDIVFDVIANVTADQFLLFTNLGHEPLARRFRAFYCHADNHFFVEISEYSADRSRIFGRQSFGIAGGIWQDQLEESEFQSPPKLGKAISLGRVLPHKGLEITISALPEDWELDVVGPLGDDHYLAWLRLLAQGKRVRFLGPLSDREKRERIADSGCLIASSCHTLYDARQIVQAELLGLVIFEACAQNRLPITSDVPSFREVMNRIGLGQLVYTSRNVPMLRKILQSTHSPGKYHFLLEQARNAIRQNYLWNDYWPRVTAALAGQSRNSLSIRQVTV
jgi:glycosyltransferase involved in cell wall biosynthesis